jgi:hypothetical protein
MKYYLDQNKNLVITADDEDRAELQALKNQCEEDDENFVSDRVMEDILEPLLCNSELEWSRPELIGALTSAPILAISGSEDENDEAPILKAWGYMDYQIRAVQEDLLEYGKAVFTLGWDVDSPEE